jgi:apolipoprotein N-acyltransferase
LATPPPIRPAGGAGRLLRSALSGLLLAAAFPPLDLTLVAFVGLVPLLSVLEELAASARDRPLRAWGGSAFGAGTVAGFAYFLPLLWWIVVLDAPALTIPWVRYPGTLAISGYLGLFPGLFALAYVWIRARTALPPLVVAPPLWAVSEILRGVGDLGFPWGEIGYSQCPNGPALQAAALFGIRGIGAWIVATNALALRATRPGGLRPAPILLLVAAIGLPMIPGAVRLARLETGETVRVALVQPDVGNAEKWNPDRRADIFETMGRLSRGGVEAGAELVVWPETAAPCYLLKDRVWRPWVEALTDSLGVPLFLGVPDYRVETDEDGERRVVYFNAGVLFEPGRGMTGRMDKIRLVPFGERIPFAGVIPGLDRVDFGEADFVPGEEPVVFDLGEWSFGNLVCLEAVFSGHTRELVSRGADFLVTITNDSWFGAGSGAEQHARMAVARCVETGCGMARAANSGISLGADAGGRIFGRTALFERALSVVDVPRHRVPTPYQRWGDWVGRLSILVTAVLAVAAYRRRVPATES